MAISVIDPITPAYQRAVLMTFKPFSIGKWFVLGFIAWLATLGEGGGGGNFNVPGGGGGRRAPAPAPLPAPGPWPGPGRRPAPTPAAPPDPMEEIWAWITSHVAETVLIGLAIALVIIAIVLLITWINSRGQFMFLHAIATDTFQVVAPWKQFRELANSLFAFRVCLAAVGFAVMVVIVGLALLIALPDIRAQTFGQPAVIALVLGLLLLIPAMLFFGLVSWCTMTFVSTIMYAGGGTVLEAWREFRRDVMPGQVGKLVLFLLMNILFSFGLAIGRMLVGCATCCIGFLPYLSTVLTLPLVLFMRCYSIYFLQQFGPRYVIIQERPPPPAGGFPVIGMEYPPPGPYSAPPPGL